MFKDHITPVLNNYIEREIDGKRCREKVHFVVSYYMTHLFSNCKLTFDT